MSEREAHHDPHQEQFDREIRAGVLLSIGIGLAVLTVLAAFAAFGVEKFFVNRRAAMDPPAPVMEEALAPIIVPGPRLLATPEKELAQIRRAEEEILDTYAVVDAESSIYRVPVDRAIAIVGEHGLATLGTTSGEATTEQIPHESAADGTTSDVEGSGE